MKVGLTHFVIIIGIVISFLFMNCIPVSAFGEATYEFATPGQYPYGLTYDGHNFWLTDIDTVKIYEVDKNGNWISSFDVSVFAQIPTGLAWDGEHLWLSDSLSDTIYELDKSGNIISFFDAPLDDPRDLTWDGTNLWVISSSTKINKIDTSGNVLFSMNTPRVGTDLLSGTGLTWDGSHLWLSTDDWGNEYIFKLDTSGGFLTYFEAPGNAPRGLAWSEDSLWNIDQEVEEVYSIDVNEPPTASFTYSPSTPSIEDIIAFTDTSTDDSNIATWSWNFGDGHTASAKNPTHTYSTSGTFIVKLFVTDDNGVTNFTTSSITITEIPSTPSLSVSISKDISGLSVNFSSVVSRGISPYNYTWTFGDGATSTQSSPSHTYVSSDTYTVTLTVVDSSPTQKVKSTSTTVTVTSSNDDNDGDLSVTAYWTPIIIIGIVLIAVLGIATALSLGKPKQPIKNQQQSQNPPPPPPKP